ncbi:MAG: hypothetical protein M3117_05355 [Actinomycetota bacterium]|nr:hypothetical protein [Actinomycetota bacterium]
MVADRASKGADDTFRRIADHPQDKPVVELAVDHAVPYVADLALSVTRWHGT